MIGLPALLLALQVTTGTSLDMAFHAPPDWVPINAPPLRAFAPADLAPGELVLLALWPAERVTPPDAFTAWFNRKLTGRGETVLQQSAVVSRSVDGLDALIAEQRVVLPQGITIARVVYGLASGERAVVAMLSSNQDELITRYTAPALAFFESVRFAEATSPVVSVPVSETPMPISSTPSAPEAELTRIPAAGFDGNEPRGLFYRLRVAYGTGGMETETPVFLPGRRLVRFYPFGGGDAIDLARCNPVPDQCGEYRIDGDWLTVTWNNGNTPRLSFARSEEDFTLDGDTFRPARALASAEEVGVRVDPANATAPFDTGLRLEDDGTFEWGAGGASTLRGHYEHQGLTLVLRFEDGMSKSYTLFAAGRTQPTELISFDGRVYARR